MRIMDGFSQEERDVICARRAYQPASELAAVFDCDTRTINAIVRKGKETNP